MKNDGDFYKGILEAFEKEERRIIAESRQREAEAMKELKKQDAAHGEVVAKLAESEEVLVRLKDEYLALEKKVKAECDAAVELASVTPAQVRRGEKSLADLYRAGKGESGIRQEKAAAAANELATALALVRQAQCEVWEFQRQKAELEMNIAYLAGEPARSQMVRLKAHVISLEQRLGPILTQGNTAASEAARLKELLDIADKKSLTLGFHWDDLTIEMARALAFNPAMRDDFLDEYLTKTLPEIETREKQRLDLGEEPGIYRISIHWGGYGVSPFGLSWMERNLSAGSRAMILNTSNVSIGTPINRGSAAAMPPREGEK